MVFRPIQDFSRLSAIVNAPQGRVGPPLYKDGVGTMMQDGPNPRDISNKIFEQTEFLDPATVSPVLESTPSMVVRFYISSIPHVT